MRRLFLIANPAAGRGAALRALSEVRAGLERAGVEHDIALTRAPGEAVELDYTPTALPSVDEAPG